MKQSAIEQKLMDRKNSSARQELYTLMQKCLNSKYKNAPCTHIVFHEDSDEPRFLDFESAEDELLKIPAIYRRYPIGYIDPNTSSNWKHMSKKERELAALKAPLVVFIFFVESFANKEKELKIRNEMARFQRENAMGLS